MSDSTTNSIIETASTVKGGILVTVLTAMSDFWLEFSPAASFITWVLGSVLMITAIRHNIKKTKRDS